MLLLIGLWMLVTLSALATGAALVVLCGGENLALRAPVVAWAGLAAISVVCSIWALAFPLGHINGAVLFCLSVLPLVWSKARKVIRDGFSWPAYAWVSGGALALLMGSALLKSAGPTEIFDDAVGYIVIFRALLDDGVIIGLGNLHPNLAYNSHWSLLGAFYSFEWLLGKPYYDLNGWLTWLGAWYAFSYLPNLWAGQLRAVFILLAFTPFFYFRNQMSGNSTDLPVAILTWTLVGEWLLDTGKDKPAIQRLLFVFLPFFAISIKITALALGIIPLAFCFLEPPARRPRAFFYAMLVGAVVLVPWVWRNVLMTGYAYYLFPKLDFFSVDWKMPRSVLHRLKLQVIYDFHHQPKVLSNPLWWSRWWRWGFNAQQRLMLGLTAVSLVLVLVGLAWRRSRLGTLIWYPKVLALGAMLGVGLLLWFSAATEARYAHAWLVLSCLGTVSWVVGLAPAQWQQRVGRGVAVFATLLLVVPTFRTWQETPPQVGQEILVPADYPEVAWRTVKGQNFEANFPYKFITRYNDLSRFPAKHLAERDSTPNCWCTPLPCVYKLDDLPLLQQRGPQLRDGFRFTKPPKE